MNSNGEVHHNIQHQNGSYFMTAIYLIGNTLLLIVFVERIKFIYEVFQDGIGDKYRFKMFLLAILLLAME
ncbi:hypothetical protein BCU85_18560 [Vibrio lentus]|nr:hypothetical protein BCU85_18560 [Vibrio lentus]PMK91459.1 hypothetical protein BCT88_04255 [Vibrio lentus]PML22481.1 hypothetical protein BCT80_10960 [Vibrio lentus]PMM26727.1 hypothetical protein BCT57_19155 [Vibrio lentus]PMM46823.1 hypothetical protein BCT53_07755 [Vibrio lentus]